MNCPPTKEIVDLHNSKEFLASKLEILKRYRQATKEKLNEIDVQIIEIEEKIGLE